MLTALLTACSSASDVYQNAELSRAKGKDVVIFVHGYYGSALRDPVTGRREFIHLPTVLYGSLKVSLSSKELGVLESPDLEVEGLIGHVSIIPRLYRNDVYGSFLGKLALPENSLALAYAYDWRKELPGAVRGLDAFVTSVEREQPRSISIVAHSMGGLVTAYYLAYGNAEPTNARLNWAGAAHVKKVVFLGTPFGGSIAILRNMQLGTGYPWNSDLLQPGTVSSFPASYYLLPLAGAKFLDAAGQASIQALGTFAFWDKNHLGLLRENPTPARRRYTQENLDRAGKFLALLHAEGSPPKDLKILNVVGEGRPTLAAGYFLGDRFVFRKDEARKEKLPFEPLEQDGDSSVTLAAAALPPAFNNGAQEIRSTFAHDKLFLDPKVEEEYGKFLSH